MIGRYLSLRCAMGGASMFERSSRGRRTAALICWTESCGKLCRTTSGRRAKMKGEWAGAGGWAGEGRQGPQFSKVP
jgi:hypothetical protein